MNKRLDYIDAIKGLAIFLVVMGHVLAWLYQSPDEARIIGKPMLLFEAIYAFHMPLFIFVSGFLFGISYCSEFSIFCSKLSRKAERLLIPYFICGTIVYLWRGVRPLTYWYLLSLFQLIVVVGGVLIIVGRINNIRRRMLVEVFVLLLVFIILHMVNKIANYSWLYIAGWLPHLVKMFPYFSIGFIISRYIEVEKILNNHVFSACVIIFILPLFVKLPYACEGISLQALAGIYCTFYLFCVYLTEGGVVKWLRFLGKRTIYIYLFHFFFAFRIVQLGDNFIWLSQTDKMGYISCFTLQLIYSVGISYVLVYLSLSTAKIIKSSKVLSYLIIGERV